MGNESSAIKKKDNLLTYDSNNKEKTNSIRRHPQKAEITTKKLIIALSIIAIIVILLVAGYFLFFHKNTAKTQQAVIFNNGIFIKKILPGNPTTEFLTLDNAQDYFLIAFSPTDSKLKTDNAILTLEKNIYLIATTNIFDIELTYNSKSCGLYLPIKTANYNDFTEEERTELINKIKEEYYPELDCDLVNVFEKSIIEELNNEIVKGNLKAQKNTIIYLAAKSDAFTTYLDAITNSANNELKKARITKQYSAIPLDISLEVNKNSINPIDDDFVIKITANKPLFKEDYILNVVEVTNKETYPLATESSPYQEQPFVATNYWDGSINQGKFGLKYKKATYNLEVISKSTNQVLAKTTINTDPGDLYTIEYNYYDLKKAIPPEKYSQLSLYNQESEKIPLIFDKLESNPQIASTNPEIKITTHKTYQIHPKSIPAYKFTPSETEVIKLLEQLPFLENMENLFLREQGVFEKNLNPAQFKALNDLVEKNVIYLGQPYIATVTPDFTERDNLIDTSTLTTSFFDIKQIEINTFLFSHPCANKDDTVCLMQAAYLRQLPKDGDIGGYANLEKNADINKDFIITAKEGTNKDWLFIAPHGGVIEPGTDLLAADLASEGNYGLYTFVSNNQVCFENECRSMHMTSTQFDEPSMFKLIDDYNEGVAISLHCYGSNAKDDPYPGEENEHIVIGGQNHNLQILMVKELTQLGFTGLEIRAKDYADNLTELNKLRAAVPSSVEVSINGLFAGVDSANMVNLSKDKGVQIEISRKYMRKFIILNSECGFTKTQTYHNFVTGLINAMHQYESEYIYQDVVES